MYRRILLCAAAALVLAACAGPTADILTAPSTTAATTPPSTVAAPSTLAPYFDALDRTLAAGAYRFDGTLQAQTQSGTATIQLSGWVNGADHELTLSTGDQQTTTTVKDGVATVTSSAGTTEIPVSQAAATPSLSVLRDLQDGTMIGTGEVSGTLTAAVLQGTGLSDSTAAGTVTNATVTFDPGGTLTAYTLTDAANTWTITVRISDVGQVGA